MPPSVLARLRWQQRTEQQTAWNLIQRARPPPPPLPLQEQSRSSGSGGSVGDREQSNDPAESPLQEVEFNLKLSLKPKNSKLLDPRS
jgi:hypothetical protein